jgi:tetratricopeptide (TPR) repeat protein
MVPEARCRSDPLGPAASSAGADSLGVMRVRASAACLALLAGCSYRTPTRMQRDAARALRPAQVETLPVIPPGTELPKKVLRIRAWADRDYRAQVVRWRAHIGEQLERASTLLESQFGLRLEVVSVEAWDRAGTDDLHRALEDLARTDPGRDVDFVAGFVSAVQTLRVVHEELGMAALGSRHLVLRAMASFAEAAELRRAFDKLPDDERDALLRERQLHKETAVLLHEWAHTLGASHDDSPAWIMSPVYRASHSAFSPETIQQVVAGLQRRAAEPAAADARPGPGPAARASPLDRARAGLSADEARVLDAAAGSAGAGRLDRAWETLAPLAARRLEDPAVQELACDLVSRLAPRARETLATCTRAAELPGARPEALLSLARVQIGRGQTGAAVAALATAEKGLSLSEPPPRTWLELSHLYDRARTCTGAERAAGKAGADALAQAVVADCARLRRLVALPRGTRGLPEEREHEYVAAVLEAQRDAAAMRLDRARATGRRLAKAFPGTPGPALVDCLVQGYGAEFARAKVACAAAARAAPEAFAPPYLLGWIANGERRWAAARTHLRRALELDDATADVWVQLAVACEEPGLEKELAALRGRYRARFGVELRVEEGDRPARSRAGR